MMILRFAFRNLTGAGVRTWLNIFILALVFLVIVFLQGIYDGFQIHMERIRIAEETGRTQIWYDQFDPLDTLTIEDHRGEVPESLQKQVTGGNLTPILMSTAMIYPQNRMQPVLVKGIDPQQKILEFPANKLKVTDSSPTLPAIIGTRMAERMKVNVGDQVVMRWRTVSGALDAHDITIVHVFETEAPAIDVGTVWIPLLAMQTKLNATDYASILVSNEALDLSPPDPWLLKTEDDLLADTRKLIAAKKGGGSFIYIILMFLAAISILDTQVLSIFRRRKEIGLHMALGLTQWQVIGVFTLEGVMQGLAAAVVALVIGAPVFWWFEVNGLAIFDMSAMGFPGGSALFPYFSFGLVAGTFVLVMLIVLLVSWWPTRKIGKLSPHDALRGKWV